MDVIRKVIIRIHRWQLQVWDNVVRSNLLYMKRRDNDDDDRHRGAEEGEGGGGEQKMKEGKSEIYR